MCYFGFHVNVISMTVVFAQAHHFGRKADQLVAKEKFEERRFYTIVKQQVNPMKPFVLLRASNIKNWDGMKINEGVNESVFVSFCSELLKEVLSVTQSEQVRLHSSGLACLNHRVISFCNILIFKYKVEAFLKSSSMVEYISQIHKNLNLNFFVCKDRPNWNLENVFSFCQI